MPCRLRQCNVLIGRLLKLPKNDDAVNDLVALLLEENLPSSTQETKEQKVVAMGSDEECEDKHTNVEVPSGFKSSLLVVCLSPTLNATWISLGMEHSQFMLHVRLKRTDPPLITKGANGGPVKPNTSSCDLTAKLR